jgi:hypothetical protein
MLVPRSSRHCRQKITPAREFPPAPATMIIAAANRLLATGRLIVVGADFMFPLEKE